MPRPAVAKRLPRVSAATPIATEPRRRGRGRPPAGAEVHAAIRLRLLDATRTVFTRVGYHGLSVELVLAEAELSRPTFYKHFRSTEEPMALVIAEVNERLMDGLLASVNARRDSFEAVDAGLEAWRRWGEELGPMLRPLFAELHDPHSPASTYRRRTLDILASRLAEHIEHLGRARPTRLQLDALLHGVEYLGYRFHLETEGDDRSWKQTRDAMLRLAIGLLGSEHEWHRAAQLAHALDIDLDPHDAP